MSAQTGVRDRKAELAGASTLAGLALAALLGMSYALPEEPVAVLMSNLRPHCAAVLIVAGLMLAVARRAARAVILVLPAVAVLADLGATVVGQREAWVAARGQAGARLLTVVSFNVYNRNPQDVRRVASVLAAARADVMVLLEAAILKSEMPVLRASFPFLAGCEDLHEACDTIILSRHPLSEIALRSLGPISPNRFVSARVTIGTEAVTVVAAHLTKPYFDNYGWLEVRRLARHVNALQGPLLLAGDFNAAPWSKTITLLLERTALIPGPAPIPTWPSAVRGLGLPIDHIFTRTPMVIERIRPFTDNLGSNHRGLAAQIRY